MSLLTRLREIKEVIFAIPKIIPPEGASPRHRRNWDVAIFWFACAVVLSIFMHAVTVYGIGKRWTRIPSFATTEQLGDVSDDLTNQIASVAHTVDKISESQETAGRASLRTGIHLYWQRICMARADTPPNLSLVRENLEYIASAQEEYRNLNDGVIYVFDQTCP